MYKPGIESARNVKSRLIKIDRCVPILLIISELSRRKYRKLIGVYAKLRSFDQGFELDAIVMGA
jgi:hypothetical protein